MIVMPYAGRRIASLRDRLSVPDEQETTAASAEIPSLPRPRSPLVIGAIAYALLFGMMLIVCVIIAWRLALSG